MKDKVLDHKLATGFVTELIVKQPLFRSSYIHVLDFHVKFRSVRFSMDIYLAIAYAVVQDASIFVNDSYFVTFVVEGLSSRKVIHIEHYIIIIFIV